MRLSEPTIGGCDDSSAYFSSFDRPQPCTQRSSGILSSEVSNMANPSDVTYTQTQTFVLTWVITATGNFTPVSTYSPAITGVIGTQTFSTTVTNAFAQPSILQFTTLYSITDPSPQFTTSSSSATTGSAPAVTTPPSTATSAISPHPHHSHNAVSIGAGVGVGVGVPLVAITAAAIWYLLRRRRSHPTPALSESKGGDRTSAPIYQVD